MPKYHVYGIATASKFLGEFEAATKDEAIEAARESADYHINICHHCAHEIDMGDIYEEQVDEAD